MRNDHFCTRLLFEHGFLTTSYGKRIQGPVEPLCHCNSIIQMDWCMYACQPVYVYGMGAKRWSAVMDLRGGVSAAAIWKATATTVGREKRQL